VRYLREKNSTKLEIGVERIHQTSASSITHPTMKRNSEEEQMETISEQKTNEIESDDDEQIAHIAELTEEGKIRLLWLEKLQERISFAHLETECAFNELDLKKQELAKVLFQKVSSFLCFSFFFMLFA
jgi:hypothetical protein